jgi:hypothetical protein
MLMNYECEYCKNAPRPQGDKWPRKYSWKTEKGLQNHSCYKHVLIKLEKEAAAKNERLRLEAIELEEHRKTCPIKVGDKIFFYHYIVTHPTHVLINDRITKIRYEEKRKYFAEEGIVKEVFLHHIQIEYHMVPIKHICSSLEEAENKAKQTQINYDAECEFASRCR